MDVCPPGTAADEEGLTECKKCPVGMNCARPNHPKICSNGLIPNDNQTDCLPCPVGYFCIDGIPTFCPIGTYCPNPGAKETTKCPPGSFCHGGKHKELCPIGSFCNNGTAIQCPAGTHCPQGGAFEPTDCSPGSFCTGGHHIEKCNLGSFSIGNAFNCSTCDSGYYCDQIGLIKQVIFEFNPWKTILFVLDYLSWRSCVSKCGWIATKMYRWLLCPRRINWMQAL